MSGGDYSPLMIDVDAEKRRRNPCGDSDGLRLEAKEGEDLGGLQLEEGEEGCCVRAGRGF